MAIHGKLLWVNYGNYAKYFPRQETLVPLMKVQNLVEQEARLALVLGYVASAQNTEMDRTHRHTRSES